MKPQDGKNREQSSCNLSNDDLLVKDLVRYLTQRSRLYAEQRTGNVQMSIALRDLAMAIRPYANRSIPELANILRQQSVVRASSQSIEVSKVLLPDDINDLSARDVEKLLSSYNYSKAQLIHLGASRFCISRSKLSRLLKSEVLESVRAALEHEISLAVISEEARRRGQERSP